MDIKEHTYYSSMRTGENKYEFVKMKKAEPFKVTIPKFEVELDLFYYKNGEGLFVIVEAKSGMSVGNDNGYKTLTQARKDVEGFLYLKGAELFNLAIKNATETYGISPRFRKKMKRRT